MPDPGVNCPSPPPGLSQRRISLSTRLPAAPACSLAGRHLRQAFTLVELLVVVALIGILAAVVGFSIKGGGQGMALGNAQRNVLSLIQAARAGASIQHTRARLIIYADKNAVADESASATVVNSKILRYYGVIFAESDDPHAPARPNAPNNTQPYLLWTAASNGDYLPSGLYFVPSKSSSFASDVPAFATPKTSAVDDSNQDYSIGVAANGIHGSFSAVDVHAKGITTGIMQINFPLTEAAEGESSADWYYFIEFTPDGFYYNANGNNNILIGAAETTSDSTISFRGSGDNASLLFTGVQLRALGGPAAFRSPDDFQNPGK